jgi:uncharacterized protein
MGSMNLKVNEPSMEDILASIRRIISDEQEPEFQEPPLSPLKTVLEITERHVLSGSYPESLPEAMDVETPLVEDDPFHEKLSIARFVESYEAPSSVAPMAPKASQALAQPCERNPGEALMSRMTEASVSDAFGRLNASRMASQPQTVEGLMTEMLRPMLKAWLDDNLPALVERLVKAEIERVARG